MAKKDKKSEVEEIKKELSEAAQELDAATAILMQDAQDAALSLESGVEDKVDPNEARVRECVRKIHLMNYIMGNRPAQDYLPEDILLKLTQQEKIFNEERNEFFEAARLKCITEMLDGICDMFVVQQGFEYTIGLISADDVGDGKSLPESYTGKVGTVLHSEAVGALSNVLRYSIMDTYNVARVAIESYLLGELGVLPENLIEGMILALELVCENNLSKVTDKEEVAQGWLENLTPSQLEQGWVIRTVNVDGVTWFSLLDKNGKFRKHNNFEGVSLKPALDVILEGVDHPDLKKQEKIEKEFTRIMKKYGK